MSEPISFANPSVLEFYRALPFNIRDSVEGSVEVIHQTDHAASYPPLRALVRPGLRVLDVGCGTGWFSNSLAHHHGALATGLDFNPVAIDRARAVAAAMNLPTEFIVGDLFRYEPAEPFDLVVSLGVLHHTNDCAAAVRRVCQRLVKPGGHALIGLYHAYGRKPLLEHFQAMKARGATEFEMMERYRQLHSQLKDETMLASWFRDQVMHPHETQHTLEEMVPILTQSGMALVSTSINRFRPIESLAALFEAEKGFYAVGAQRLKENQYFTGFFVFLARKSGGASIEESTADPRGTDDPPLDRAAYLQHDPIVGYRYIPGTSLELPRPGGGRYHIQVNSQGIRSDREFSVERPSGVRRLIVCGDSMAAGQFVSNTHRFSELLERRIPALEVINLALEGSGTDQQLLLYERVGLRYEHDAVVLLPFLQNIRRNMVEAREGIDPRTGQHVLRAKPRFELLAGQLVLRNVPVPEEVIGRAVSDRDGTDTRSSLLLRLKTRLSALPGAALVKKGLYAMVPWEPFPEYARPTSPEWQLMSALVRRIRELAGDRPVVVAPTFYSSYVRFRMARNYWKRYAELAATPGIHPVDLLPHFRREGVDGPRCFQEPYDMHFSAYGNLVLADALEAELGRLGLLPLS